MVILTNGEVAWELPPEVAAMYEMGTYLSWCDWHIVETRRSAWSEGKCGELRLKSWARGDDGQLRPILIKSVC